MNVAVDNSSNNIVPSASDRFGAGASKYHRILINVVLTALARPWFESCSLSIDRRCTFRRHKHSSAKEGTMALAGVIVTFLGFLLAASSVGLSSSTGVRLVIVLVGIVISLAGIMGLINPAYQKNAVWNK